MNDRWFIWQVSIYPLKGDGQSLELLCLFDGWIISALSLIFFIK